LILYCDCQYCDKSIYWYIVPALIAFWQILQEGSSGYSLSLSGKSRTCTAPKSCAVSIFLEATA